MTIERPLITRSVPLIDMEIERGGDGRTVTAYAATFSDPYEVRDFEGHYDEVINRSAFNRAVNRPDITRAVQVVFNHGRTLWGTPSERYSMPLGTPLEVKADDRGLLTRTRYSKTELGDEVLELIRDGAIRAQSFRGPIFRSAPPLPGPNGRPVRERLELGLLEYGPAPFVANVGAEILAVRSSLLAERFETIAADLSPEERAELAQLLTAGTPSTTETPGAEDSPPPDTPASQPAEEAPDDTPDPSPELLILAQQQRKRRLGIES